MKKLILPFLFFLPIVTAQAQGGVVLRGSVFNEQNTEIPYANVTFLSETDSTFLCGAMTDEKGVFEFSCENTGKGILRISFIGYDDFFRTVTTDGNSADVGKCVLHEKTIGLAEVTVTARRPQIVMQGNTLVTSIANTVLSNAGTASDVLKYVPSVLLDEDRITVLGKGTPEIYINNRKVRDNSELEQLHSTDIARIELIRNPGALYDAETRAVLKIITIKRYTEGLELQLSARGMQNKRFADREVINLNYRIRGLTLSLSYMHGTGKRIMTSDIDQINRGDTLWKEKKYSTYLQDNPYHTFSSSINYDINPKHSVGMQYRLQSTDAKGASQKGDDWYEIYAGDELYAKASVGLVGNGNTKQHTLNFFYDGRISERLHTHLDADYL
ncbi:MAG: carboxypeptidase-like regulatory domain-containing protein, partial [Tannerellaceae bacterium]|nr:carboxypeptidase-like regulatory domain-containing protein [Tannerellaceae bacterium]